jgi:hypothetical protein
MDFFRVIMGVFSGYADGMGKGAGPESIAAQRVQGCIPSPLAGMFGDV